MSDEGDIARGIHSLPRELFDEVVDHLDGFDITQLRAASRSVRSAVDNVPGAQGYVANLQEAVEREAALRKLADALVKAAVPPLKGFDGISSAKVAVKRIDAVSPVLHLASQGVRDQLGRNILRANSRDAQAGALMAAYPHVDTFSAPMPEQMKRLTFDIFMDRASSMEAKACSRLAMIGWEAQGQHLPSAYYAQPPISAEEHAFLGDITDFRDAVAGINEMREHMIPPAFERPRRARNDAPLARLNNRLSSIRALHFSREEDGPALANYSPVDRVALQANEIARTSVGGEFQAKSLARQTLRERERTRNRGQGGHDL